MTFQKSTEQYPNTHQTKKKGYLLMADGHGGARIGAGRPKLPNGEKKHHVTVSIRPHTKRAWTALARAAGVPKSGTVEWLVHSPDAGVARAHMKSRARRFIRG